MLSFRRVLHHGELLVRIFSEGTVSTDRYLQMINIFFLPTLHHRRCLKWVWFQHDGAICHTANRTLTVFCKAFGIRIISKGVLLEWPPHSWNLTAPDFFLWGYLEARVNTDHARDLVQLRQRIMDEIARIPVSILQRVFRNWVSKLWSCIASDIHHLNDVFHS